jgi:hypothetical protein
VLLLSIGAHRERWNGGRRCYLRPPKSFWRSPGSIAAIQVGETDSMA